MCQNNFLCIRIIYLAVPIMLYRIRWIRSTQGLSFFILMRIMTCARDIYLTYFINIIYRFSFLNDDRNIFWKISKIRLVVLKKKNKKNKTANVDHPEKNSTGYNCSPNAAHIRKNTLLLIFNILSLPAHWFTRKENV